MTSKPIKPPVSMKNTIINICDMTIDMSKVTHVGEVGGDREWLRYTVYLEGGGGIEFYHQREYSGGGGRKLRQMNRDKFIRLWKETLNP